MFPSLSGQKRGLAPSLAVGRRGGSLWKCPVRVEIYIGGFANVCNVCLRPVEWEWVGVAVMKTVQ